MATGRTFSPALRCQQTAQALGRKFQTREPLGKKFLPIVTTATERVSLADKYNAVAAKATGLGLVKKEDANIQQYVTGKTLDGLYLMISEEEKKIRSDPVSAGSAVLRKVFGALR